MCDFKNLRECRTKVVWYMFGTFYTLYYYEVEGSREEVEGNSNAIQGSQKFVV